MYVAKIRIVNHGPIDDFNISMPFRDGSPQPLLLVGANGTGKSILLSHIVNGLISAKDIVYPNTTEIETNRVYKLRSNSYIKSGHQLSYARVDYQDNNFIEEIRLLNNKGTYAANPSEISEESIDRAWDQIEVDSNEHFDTSFRANNRTALKTIFDSNCVVYCPFNRFEEPAWLNQQNLTFKAQYMDLKHIEGSTDRTIVNLSPLREVQNWLFDLIYDRSAFEIQTPSLAFEIREVANPVNIPIFAGHAGEATSAYDVALSMVQILFGSVENPRFGLGRRHNRVISLMSGDTSVVPNLFQLSSGETSLLDVFLSILRDFDLTRTSFNNAAEIKGIAVIDEIDLHLHANHQFSILPQLIQLLPNVQFIITTHSPLFVLGMRETMGDDGFAVYRLPDAKQIDPEEFGEFKDAYRALTRTQTFADQLEETVLASHKTLVYVEGATDVKYFNQAAELLGKVEMLNRIEFKDGDSNGGLNRIWAISKTRLSNDLQRKVIVMHDPEDPHDPVDRGTCFRRSMPLQTDNPIKKGIENLFNKSTLETAIEHKPDFIDVEEQHSKTERGQQVLVDEKWTINENEKTNLCDWLCEHGTADDFRLFEESLNMIQEIIDDPAVSP